MLHIPLETLCYIIAKAREFQAKEEVVIPDAAASPTEDWALQILADHGEDYTLIELMECVGAMDQRQRAELVALMWVGRGDYTLEDWEAAVDDAIGDYSVRAAAYLIAHPMVAEDLEEGLIAHGYSCEE
ncbi:MAG TPA: DUF3775 domain-containing protein [Lamprocystis sp. (in: g-proteobacteria)]|nr:DUF3775 domain-containing protein [Lamprocystis sp. (in: g-proteobacteria)]